MPLSSWRAPLVFSTRRIQSFSNLLTFGLKVFVQIDLVASAGRASLQSKTLELLMLTTTCDELQHLACWYSSYVLHERPFFLQRSKFPFFFFWTHLGLPFQHLNKFFPINHIFSTVSILFYFYFLCYEILFPNIYRSFILSNLCRMSWYSNGIHLILYQKCSREEIFRIVLRVALILVLKRKDNTRLIEN